MEPTELIVDAIRCVMRGEIYLSPKLSTRLIQKLILTEKGCCSMDALSARELEVFLLIGQGLGTRQIAGKLHLSPKTIETHRSNIKRKLCLADGTALVKHAIEWSKTGSGF